ncbi:kinase-like protein [Heliocybe sulcata]|uniref:Kinase-like protein n=1 Tax=Heliocybe sulcata TaxID=5364 RepID=A0A5C3MQL6_9AGAM|nr:kinase-like protein [Heliocybe sulcata]
MNDLSRQTSQYAPSVLFSSPVPPSTPATSIHALDAGAFSDRDEPCISVSRTTHDSLLELKQQMDNAKKVCLEIKLRWEELRERTEREAHLRSLSDNMEGDRHGLMTEENQDPQRSLVLETGHTEDVDDALQILLQERILSKRREAEVAEIEGSLSSLLGSWRDLKRLATHEMVAHDGDHSTDDLPFQEWKLKSSVTPATSCRDESPDFMSSSEDDVARLSPTADMIRNITGQIDLSSPYPVACGGFADVYPAVWFDGMREEKVAIKVLRPQYDECDTLKIQKKLKHELRVWCRLRNPHILPLHGVVDRIGKFTAMVSPWKENGRLSKYVERQGEALTLFDRLELLCQIAVGLTYLHGLSPPVVHGDLTSSNVLIDEHGKAFLADFGLSIMITECHANSSSHNLGAVRWAAPEIYLCDARGQTCKVGTECDVYSFGSVMFEILSGHVPYHYLDKDIQVVMKLLAHNKPLRPTESEAYITDEYWEFIQWCWADDPKKRPSINQILTRIQGFREAASTSLI